MVLLIVSFLFVWNTGGTKPRRSAGRLQGLLCYMRFVSLCSGWFPLGFRLPDDAGFV